jgi:hypothetical protein
MFSDQDNRCFKTTALSILPILSLLFFFLISSTGSSVYVFGSSSFISTDEPSVANSFLFVKSAADYSWTGRYEFTDVAGWRERGRGGAIPSVSYSVTVTERNGKLIAELEASGFQVNDDYACTAKAAGSRLNVYYQSGGTGFDKSNPLGFKKGQLLLSLIKTSSGKRTLYLYQPAGYRIFLFGSKKKKIYFSKS